MLSKPSPPRPAPSKLKTIEDLEQRLAQVEQMRLCIMREQNEEADTKSTPKGPAR